MVLEIFSSKSTKTLSVQMFAMLSRNSSVTVGFFLTLFITIQCSFPKQQNDDTLSHYRPIAMENFKLKIISKLLADKLAQILPTLISKEQRSFVHNINIKDYISLTSEAVNMLLHHKSVNENLVIKIDIAKAYGTLDWNFPLQDLSKFGFCFKFCKWIRIILISTKLYISINGK